MSLSYGFNLDAAGKKYTSAEFSEMFYQVMGDSVSKISSNLNLTLNGGLSVTLAPGFLYVAGRWINSIDPLTFVLSPASATGARYDAIAAVVNYTDRKVEFTALTGVDPDNPVRNSSEYQLYLYVIQVQQGTMVLYETDITDKRVLASPLSDIYGGILDVYEFTASGIDDEIAELEGECTTEVTEAGEMVSGLQRIVENSRDVQIGDIRESIIQPEPMDNWLACDGLGIPSRYSALRAIVGSSTPYIGVGDARFTAWIYAGAPS